MSESREALVAKMRKLAIKGGAATKRKYGAEYYAQIGRLGGIANGREHGNDAEMNRKRLENANNRMRTIVAAGKTVLRVSGE